MKKIYIILIGFSAIAFISVACKQQQPVITKISGIVINTGSREPIQGALVVMQDGVGNTSGFFGNTNTTGTGATQQQTTGIDGKFSFTFEGEAPVIWVEKEQYRFLNKVGAYEIQFLSPGKTNDSLTLTMDAYAWFNPILKGHNCLPSDSVLIFPEYDFLPPIYKWGGGYFTYHGNGPHKFSVAGDGLLARGDLYYPYGIQWQEHGIWQNGRIDSVYIKSFETYTDTIYY